MIAWILTPFGRILTGISIVILLCTGVYLKGRHDGISSYKIAIEREINESIKKGKTGSANALKQLDAGRVPSDWWID